ncbi:MAG: MerR family transcriptional regulator [Candidatus Dormibacteria bacterium]
MLQIEPESDYLTIDQLAQGSGMTVRNIRAHQARGLLPPPRLRGRTGLYDQEHLARARLILELQAEGLNLEAIKNLMERTPAGSARDALALRQSLLRPWTDEEPVTVSAEELRERLGNPGPEVIADAVRADLVQVNSDGSYRVISPALLKVAEQLVDGGLSMGAVMKAHDRLVAATDQISQVFVDLFETEVWKPFVEQGRPRDDWQRVMDVLERTRPLAAEATIANLRRSMRDAIEKSVARDLQL